MGSSLFVAVLYAALVCELILCVGRGPRDFSANAVFFDYCQEFKDLKALEFQVTLAIVPFADASTSLGTKAERLFQNFLDVADSAVEAHVDYDEEVIFAERSWFLTEPDGQPLPSDSASDPPYTTSCYVRTREKRKIKHGMLKSEAKISASLKIRGVNPVDFPKPDIKKDSMDCDVYADVHRATYKVKVKKLDPSVQFGTFGDVLEHFPFASDFFFLRSTTQLPERDSYVTHRFTWEKVKMWGIAMSCDMDVRFRSEESAVAGIGPYTGEFSCSLEPEEIEDDVHDVRMMVEFLSSIFSEFQLTSSWVESISPGYKGRLHS